MVDASQGIQAQTLSNFRMAQKSKLHIIPVINKIDMPAANVQGVTAQIVENLDFEPHEIVSVSAKTGQNVPLLLDRIMEAIPCPSLETETTVLKGKWGCW